MQPEQVLLRPLTTEATQTNVDRHFCVTFAVARAANKHHIRQAVENKFSVRVAQVRTAVMPGKLKRRGSQITKRPSWKKARITLPDLPSVERVTQAPK